MGYSTEHKQAVLRKLVPPYNRVVPDLAKEEGVSTAAIYHWRKVARANPRRWSGRARNWEPVGAVWLNPEKPLDAA